MQSKLAKIPCRCCNNSFYPKSKDQKLCSFQCRELEKNIQINKNWIKRDLEKVAEKRHQRMSKMCVKKNSYHAEGLCLLDQGIYEE